MKGSLSFNTIERSVVRNKKLKYTAISYSAILAILMNLASFQSPLIGSIASIIYLLINAMFLGNAFFEKESDFFRFMFGILLLTTLLGFVGWLALIIYNLDTLRVTLVLVVVATSSSLLNRRMKYRNVQK